MGRIWSICSGSGGVGKTTIAVSLAAGAAKAGYKTILLDASGISRSCDLILGLENVIALDMTDVLSNQIDLSAALYPASQYEKLYLACSSLYNVLSTAELSSIILALHSLCDILVIDMPSGQCPPVRSVMRKGDEILLVARPDAASVRAAERLAAQCGNAPVSCSLIVNRVGRERFRRKKQYTQDMIQNLLELPVLSSIPDDSSIPECESRTRAAIECDGPAWTVLSSLVKSLLSGV